MQKIKEVFFAKVFVRWFVACTVAFSLGDSIGRLVGGKIYEIANFQWILSFRDAENLGLVTHSIIIGIIIGLSQWLVLREKVPITMWWMLTFAFGWLLSAFILQYSIQILSLFLGSLHTTNFLAKNVAYILEAILFGGLIGLPQYILLRKVYPRSLIWIPITMLSLLLGFSFGRFFSMHLYASIDFLRSKVTKLFPLWLSIGAATGAGYALLSGYMLARITGGVSESNAT